MIHLDTNYLINAVRVGSKQTTQVNRWIAAGERLRCSAMAWSEFMCGPVTGDAVEAAHGMIGEPFTITAADAEQAAELFNRTGRRRGSLADCLIAAAALRAGATLATANLADFSPFAPMGLLLVS